MTTKQARLAPHANTQHHANGARAADFTAITELPGSLLTREQHARMAHRYAMARRWARGSHILEVACGAGSGLGVWSDDDARTVVGIDYTAAVLGVAQAAHAARVPLAQADAMRLPVADASVDTILCFEALYYLPDAAAFCAEAWRALRPGGLLHIGQANPHWPSFAPGRMTTRYHAAHELAALLRAAGFARVRLYGAFPVAQVGLVGRARAQARRLVLGAGLLPTAGPLAERFKRLAYGRLEPLSPALPPPTHAELEQAEAALTPLDAGHPDTRHRVLYATAER